MKHLKRWLALAVSAALALTLLAGCHTGGISSRLLLDLLAGELENVQVETDSSFDRALKAAVQKGGSDPDAVLDALIDELNISGGAVNFSISGIGSASAGRQSLNVVFQPGSNPSTAANNAATGWLGVLRGLSGSGEYSGLVSMVEVNGGYILAISVTVEQPGNIGSDDDDDNDPTPEPGFKKTGEYSYEVYNADGLQYVAALVNKGENGGKIDITLPQNGTIDLSGMEWTPIGNDSAPYTGKFDGNHCTITGLTISSSDENVGLFGFIGEKGKVENLTLKDAAVSGSQFVGGVAGISLGTITGCKAEGGSVSGKNFVGGVVAQNFYGTVTACYATGSVTGFAYVGGVAGWNGGPLTACYHAGGNVSGSWDVGGVAGGSEGTKNITACYWSGSVTPTTDSDGNSAPHGIGSINNNPTSATNDNATQVDGTNVTWETAYNAMDSAAPGYYQYIDETTPPTLKQK